jgi:hypothetical protein
MALAPGRLDGDSGLRLACEGGKTMPKGQEKPQKGNKPKLTAKEKKEKKKNKKKSGAQ